MYNVDIHWTMANRACSTKSNARSSRKGIFSDTIPDDGTRKGRVEISSSWGCSREGKQFIYLGLHFQINTKSYRASFIINLALSAEWWTRAPHFSLTFFSIIIMTVPWASVWVCCGGRKTKKRGGGGHVGHNIMYNSARFFASFVLACDMKHGRFN